MKLKAPPFGEVTVSSSSESSYKMNSEEQAAFAEIWPELWPVYREVLEKLFSDYDHENLFEKKQTTVLLEKLAPEKNMEGADLLLRFSFDDSGITWDIFQRGHTLVHWQPVF